MHNGELALHSAGDRNDQSFQGCSLTETCWNSIAMVLGTEPTPGGDNGGAEERGLGSVS